MPIGQAYRNGIKSVQRGTAALSASNFSVNVTISPVDIAKTELRCLGSENGASDTTTEARVALIDATTVEVRRCGSSSRAATVGWELTEFY